jgi:hypothetical protein
MMKTPVGLVTVALAVAILLAALLVVVTGTRGENRNGAVRMLSPPRSDAVLEASCLTRFLDANRCHPRIKSEGMLRSKTPS